MEKQIQCEAYAATVKFIRTDWGIEPAAPPLPFRPGLRINSRENDRATRAHGAEAVFTVLFLRSAGSCVTKNTTRRARPPTRQAENW